MNAVGRYQIKSELGRGGMATVYRAYDPRFRREVAVKVLPREFLHDTGFRNRFEREAQTIAALEHPAIVPVYDYGEADGILYLVMRYLPGGSLARRMAQGPLPLDETVRILQHLAPGLDYAHAQGMVHRDLKPGNILFDAWENPYLSDFGIVKLALSSETALTKTGGLVGTPAYMSPEQVRGLEELDGRSDVYALGVLLYQMLSGKLPYEADTPIGQAFMHVNAPVPVIGEVRRDLSPAVAQVVTRALAKEREERQDTAGDLAENLAQATVATTPPAQEATAGEPAPQQGAAAALSSPQSAAADAPALTPIPATETDASLPRATETPRPDGGRRIPIWGWGLLAIFLLILCAGSVLVLGRLLRDAGGTATTGNTTVAGTPANTTSPVAASSLTCNDPLGCVSIASGDPIRIAATVQLDGPLTELALDLQRGVEMAITQRGDILGHDIELQIEDEACSREGAQTSAQAIVSDRTIVGLISGSCARFALPAARIISENGYVMIASWHASPEVTDPETRQNGYFRTSNNYVKEGYVTAHFAYNELGARSAAAIHQGSDASQGIATAFRDAFMALGGDVLAFEEVDRTVTDVAPIVEAITAGGTPDFLYYPVSRGLGALLTQQARQAQALDDAVLAGSEEMRDPGFLQDAGDAALGMFLSSRAPDFDSTAYSDFLAAYEQAYGEAPTTYPAHAHAYAYDATNILLDALEQVVQAGDDDILLIGRQALRDAVAATAGHPGITGTLTCDEHGDCADPSITVNEVQESEGSLTFVPRTYTAPTQTSAPVTAEATASPGAATAEIPVTVADLSCDDPLGCVSVAPGEPLHLASMLDLSGPAAELGRDTQRGVEMAMETRAEIAGHPLDLRTEDSACSREGGQAAAQTIVSDPSIVGLIGTSCSSAALPAAQIVAENGYVMISPSNTTPGLTEPQTRQEGYFRTSHNDKVQGLAMAQFAYDELGARTAAAIHEGEPYSEGLARVFGDAFVTLGGEMIAIEPVSLSAGEVQPLLDAIRDGGPPDFLYYPVFANVGAAITEQARQMEGLSDTILAGSDGMLIPLFLQNTGDEALGMFLSGPDLTFESPLYEDFLATYEERYGEAPPAPFHAHAFDATNILLDAIEQVVQVGNDGTLLIGRQALRDAVGATTDYAGITGTLTCDENGDCAYPRIAVHEVQDTDDGPAFVPIWTYTP